jgi:hypothetical protein
MDTERDTDTSLAILSSLLEPASFPLDQLLDALTDADGDPAVAAEQLLLPRIKSSGKRKTGTSLESWLSRKRDKAALTPPTTPPKRSPSRASSSTPTKPPVDLLRVLKQADGVKVKQPPRPPIALPSQAAIDKHGLPLTILESPLSPAFASALYLAMMKESEEWERHRWFLAGKWVESPHTMTSFARMGGGYGDEAGSSKYYYSGSELSRSKVSKHRPLQPY